MKGLSRYLEAKHVVENQRDYHQFSVSEANVYMDGFEQGIESFVDWFNTYVNSEPIQESEIKWFFNSEK